MGSWGWRRSYQGDRIKTRRLDEIAKEGRAATRGLDQANQSGHFLPPRSPSDYKTSLGNCPTQCLVTLRAQKMVLPPLASLLLQLIEHTDVNLSCQVMVSQQQTHSRLPWISDTGVKAICLDSALGWSPLAGLAWRYWL